MHCYCYNPFHFQFCFHTFSIHVLTLNLLHFGYYLFKIHSTASSTWLIQATATTSASRVITTTTTIPSSPTSVEQNIILFTAVLVLLILFITIVIITIGITLFIVCRRKTNLSHTTKQSKYAEVELQQNECYASCNNNDKPPQYVQHNLLHMNITTIIFIYMQI